MNNWIDFCCIGESKSGKTLIWEVKSFTGPTGEVIGYIKWYAPWHKYSFFPLPNTVFEQVCLKDLYIFCKTETKKHKKLSRIAEKKTSVYYGVLSNPSKKNPWRAYCQFNGRVTYLGSFPKEKAAAEAVDAALIKRGKPARNFLQAQLKTEQEKATEQLAVDIYGPQVVVWECTNCSAEYEQKEPPERCVKCGKFSFEENIYRRRTG